MNPTKHILIVEDDPDIADLLRFQLMRAGYQVTQASDGDQALRYAVLPGIDLVLLDIMLPGRDGISVCQTLRLKYETAKLPIILLTAKGQEEDIVAGLESGADDYITKPFSPEVLKARVEAVLRRSSYQVQPLTDSKTTANIRGIEIDRMKRRVFLQNEEIILTYTEFELLNLLIQVPGKVYTRSQIVDLIRGTNHAITDRSVDVQVVGLRKKMKEFGIYIETVRGVGYRFRDRPLPSNTELESNEFSSHF